MAGETLDELLAMQERRAQAQQGLGGQLGQAQGGGLMGLIRGILGMQSGQGATPPPVDPREERRRLEELRIQNELKRLGL